jgi:2-phosphosulfolactate phosphatase
VKFFVYHTPEETPSGHLPDCAIAIDVLRATTTIATALHVGAEAVQAFSDIDKLMQVSEAWAADKRIRAGERGGNKVEGCDLGNSPLDHTPDKTGSKRLFMSTTNGTRCLSRIQDSRTVLTAALVNRQTVVDYLLRYQPETVWMVGSGWEGSYALEDTVCAGAIADGILQRTEHGFDEVTGNDELVAAVTLYRHWQHRLLDLLKVASHGQRLLRLGNIDDLKYCAQLDTLKVLPMQREPGVLVDQLSESVPVGVGH